MWCSAPTERSRTIKRSGKNSSLEPTTVNRLAQGRGKSSANLCYGHLWNLAILNCASDGILITAHRVVDFHEVYTVPRQFLESFLAQRNEQCLRLSPPYREHLSQAFARFFMRVGLPTSIEEAW